MQEIAKTKGKKELPLLTFTLQSYSATPNCIAKWWPKEEVMLKQKVLLKNISNVGSLYHVIYREQPPQQCIITTRIDTVIDNTSLSSTWSDSKSVCKFGSCVISNAMYKKKMEHLFIIHSKWKISFLYMWRWLYKNSCIAILFYNWQQKIKRRNQNPEKRKMKERKNGGGEE